MQVTTKNLVQAIEVWRPDASTNRLEWSNGLYCGREDIAESRRGWGFASGNGIVGQAWVEGTPILLPANEESLGQGLDALAASHVVAIPSMQEGTCRGVVTLICDDSDQRQGAMEVWEPNDRGELSLASSWYANLQHFGLISNYVKFPRRAGLPGTVWQDRFPRVMGSLSTSGHFIRIAGAKADGLSTATGIPMMSTSFELRSVLLLLSSERSPIARVMEVWSPDPETQELQIVSADYGSYLDLATQSRELRFASGEGLAGKAFEEQAPCATCDLAGCDPTRGDLLTSHGLEWGVALPVFVGKKLSAVVTLIH